LGTIDKLHAALKFYSKYKFTPICKNDLPKGFEINSLDNLFFRKEIEKI